MFGERFFGFGVALLGRGFEPLARLLQIFFHAFAFEVTHAEGELRGIRTFLGAVGLPLQFFLFFDGLFHFLLLELGGGERSFRRGGGWSGGAGGRTSSRRRLRADLRFDAFC